MNETVRNTILSVCGATLILTLLSLPTRIPFSKFDLFSPPINTVRDIHVLFVGDLFFDRYIRQMGETYGVDHLLSCADSLLLGKDLVVGNLEGPITNNPSISVGSVVGSPNNYRFTFPTSTAALLYAHNITVVTIGNNHIGNFGTDGLRSTRKYLSAAGVHSFGGLLGSEPVYRTTVRQKEFSFVSFNQFGGASADTVAQTVYVEHALGRTVVVFAHWGDEYSLSIARLHPIAELFVNSGASLVVGSHPHIVLPHEYIHGVPVYYSLGNFLFDQYWKSDVTHGLALDVTFSNTTIGIQEQVVVLQRDGSVCPE